MRVELEVVLVEVIEELVRAENLSNSKGGHRRGWGGGAGLEGEREREGFRPHLDNLDELVIVVVSVKEGLLTEDHPREHATEGPHVERVIVIL